MPKLAPEYPEHVRVVIRALKRARKLARKVSQETNTPLIYMKGDKIIKEMIAKAWVKTQRFAIFVDEQRLIPIIP